MKKRKIILFDFDRVLIDTDKIKAGRLGLAQEFGVSRTMAKRIYAVMSRKGIAPQKYFEYLITDPKQRMEAITKADAFYLVPRKYNFPGVEMFLRRLSESCELILFTHGHRGHQLLKLDQSKLKPFFKRIIFTRSRGKHEDIKFFYEKYGDRALLVEDSDEALKEAKKVGMKAIKVRTGSKNKAYYQKLLKRVSDKLCISSG